MDGSWRLVLFCGAIVSATASAAPPALLPQPRSVVTAPGAFVIDHTTMVAVTANDAGAHRGAAGFIDLLRRTRGFAPRIDQRGTVRFHRIPGMAAEAYRLQVTPKGATITASDDAGLFYGGVTLWQLATTNEPVGAVTITDAPRFAWRGLMLDSARHYQSPAFIRRLIDAMAAHKLNILHWHLTDDQGWRIEIRKYPRLTEVGAWRTPASAPGAPPLPRTGGFYSQAEIREIVAYASARAVTIVPEIEMPGHALAAIRAYPALGTGVRPPPGIESDWGVFPYLFNVEEPTFAFLEDVLTEVLALFPGRFIHIGGDEAVKDQWRASARVQARMRALGLADERALQGWFTARIGRFLDARGRRLIGWDEILDGGLPAGATVMSWRGIDGAVAAAKAGHDAVLAPAPTLYLDHRQGNSPAEPPGRNGVITLANVYAFDPVPATLGPDEQRRIIGLQANLWTEHVRTEARAAQKLFPRASAVAELGWSARKGDFADFVDRLVPQIERLAALGIEAAPSAFAVEADQRPGPSGGTIVRLGNQIGSPIAYTLDGSAPTAISPRYTAPLALATATRLRAVAVRGESLLAGALDRRFDAATARRRDDNQLKRCTERVVLALEDDAPAHGPRAVFLTDILGGCWIYEAAPLDAVTAIAVDVGQLPFNFQIGRDRDAIRLAPPATPAGEIEVRLGCGGGRIAVLPLGPASANPALTTLTAAIAPRTGTHDLCFTYTARGPDPLWAIDAVQLIAQ